MPLVLPLGARGRTAKLVKIVAARSSAAGVKLPHYQRHTAEKCQEESRSGSEDTSNGLVHLPVWVARLPQVGHWRRTGSPPSQPAAAARTASKMRIRVWVACAISITVPGWPSLRKYTKRPRGLSPSWPTV